MKTKQQLKELYQFPGTSVEDTLKGVFGDSAARVVTLNRTEKKRYAVFVVASTELITTNTEGGFAIWTLAACGFGSMYRFVG
jgi:hypothetical protein